LWKNKNICKDYDKFDQAKSILKQRASQKPLKKEFFSSSTILKVQFLFECVVDFRAASGAHHQSLFEREAVTSRWLLSLPKSG
jgi:hypothetical protein